MATEKSRPNRPIKKELEPGTYWWCACGKSTFHPFCDGSHSGTRKGPKKLVIEEKKTVFLCGCGQSGTAPFCDGSHKDL